MQARFLQLGGEVQTALRAALWNTPLRDGVEATGSSALGAISALEGSLRMATEAVAGCTDDWSLPDTASARVGAQHLTQACGLSRCVRLPRVKHALASGVSSTFVRFSHHKPAAEAAS